jgi:hypothetical protein
VKNLILIALLSFSSLALAQTKSNTNHEAKSIESKNVTLIDEQLAAYNRRDLEAFLNTYSDDIKIYSFPNKLSGEGKEYMTKIYGKFFKETPNLHCEIVNRTMLGNTIIDHEKVTGLGGGASMEAIAIYKVNDNKISEVYFISK